MQTIARPPSRQQPDTLLSALRAGTHALHERLESRLEIAACLASLRDYQTLLESFYGFYVPLEESMAAPECAAAWVALSLSFESRRKAGLLEADLRAFGMTTRDLARLKRCPTKLLASPCPPAELAGCAYVLEGATLGGQVIGKMLEQKQGLRPGEPGTLFFNGYGGQTGKMWQQFRRAAEELMAREETAHAGLGARTVRQAVVLARRTFTSMEEWMMQTKRGQTPLIAEGDAFCEKSYAGRHS